MKGCLHQEVLWILTVAIQLAFREIFSLQESLLFKCYIVSEWDSDGSGRTRRLLLTVFITWFRVGGGESGKDLPPSSQIHSISQPTFSELGPMFFTMSEECTEIEEMAFSCFKALLGCGDKPSGCFHIVLGLCVYEGWTTFIPFFEKVNQLQYVPFLDLSDATAWLSC